MDKTEQVKDLYEGAMSLYNTIDIESNKVENKYTNAEDKVKEVLNGDEPLYIDESDGLAAALFQDVNVGYGVCGVRYLDMITNNKNISAMVLGYALQLVNKLAKENQDLAIKKEINNKEFEGISEN